MIPIQLTIEGLYSYQERQTIDFSNLIEAGLFGIFGAVGSGKSSILEAITFALYGETERLNSRDKRSYNMMNLKSNRSYIEFDFLNYDNKEFRITRDFKRNSKRFDDVKSPTVVFFEKIGENWLPLDHQNAEKLIGLSYANFKRTIIIPQGQFKEFIELGATDRTRMMKEIFNLHRFDLQDKVNSLAKKNQSALDQLEGKLSGFETVTEDYIKELEIKLSDENRIALKFQDEYTVVNEKFQQLKALKTDFENLKQKKVDFEKLFNQKKDFDERQVQLENYELIFNIFNQLFIDQNKVTIDVKEKSTDLENQKKQLGLIENQIKDVALKIEQLKPDFEALSIKRKEENELEFIVQILNFTEEISILKERSIKGEEKVKVVKDREKNIQNLIQNSEKEIGELSQKRIDSTILMEVGNWFNQHQILQQTLSKQQLKLTDVKKNVEELNQKIQTFNLESADFEQIFQKKFEDISTKKITLEKQKTEIEVQQKLADYAHSLHDGQPCPLCGSADHPNITATTDVEAKLTTITSQLNDLELVNKTLLNQQAEIQNLTNQKQFLNDQIAHEQTVLESLLIQDEDHQKLFIWKEFKSSNYEDFIAKKNAELSIEQTIKQKNTFVASQRELLNIERENLEKFGKALVQFQLEEAQKESQIQQNKERLKVLQFSDFEKFSVHEVQQKWKDLIAFNQKIEEDYTNFSEILNELNPKFASQKTAIQLTEKQIIELNSELEQCKTQIEAALISSKMTSIDEVKSVLDLHLNVSEIRKELEDFRIKFETLNNSIKELEEKLISVSFDENAFVQQEEQLNLIVLKVKEANENVTKTKAEIERLQKAYEAKKDLLKELELIQKRGTNLTTLKNMFTAAGFVQYVSSIYLKQLCDNANVRFHRMTRNQLSLQINEANEFEIIDYLNEGRSRSVKTLSGGQSFQVSLSLALALAESVQANSKAERNFFFIDEGFGTQDAEAVNIVFETLNHLHKENRIVGIISHVEELKERIPMALNIVKDEEHGSKITIV